jgi:hypothetical protein
MAVYAFNRLEFGSKYLQVCRQLDDMCYSVLHVIHALAYDIMGGEYSRCRELFPLVIIRLWKKISMYSVEEVGSRETGSWVYPLDYRSSRCRSIMYNTCRYIWSWELLWVFGSF